MIKFSFSKINGSLLPSPGSPTGKMQDFAHPLKQHFSLPRQLESLVHSSSH